MLILNFGILFCFLRNVWCLSLFDAPFTPEQVHIALGSNVSSITVTWVTQAPTPIPTVVYGTELLNSLSYGSTTTLEDGGKMKRKIYIHVAVLPNLEPEKMYYYRCGSILGWSNLLKFRTLPTHSSWTVRLGIFGDMGLTNARALPKLIQETTVSDNFDVFLHVGDFAYNMETFNGRVGDQFMQMIEPIASQVPYMTAPGNHEAAYNFSHYKARFKMPGGDGQSQFYSFDVGSAHIISFSSEFYYYDYYGWDPLVRQFEWLIKDLKEANKPENRIQHPWIIAMGHRPMYCSNNDDPMHCDNVNNLVRTGFPFVDYEKRGYILGLEKLFYDQGVDIIIGAHEHSYERFWPVYNMTVCNSSTADPYNEPDAPVHIVTGSAGCSEGEDPFIPNGKPWSAFRSDDYGFTRMTIYNHTHLKMEQISVEGTSDHVIDEFTIIKKLHGPGSYNCHLKQ